MAAYASGTYWKTISILLGGMILLEVEASAQPLFTRLTPKASGVDFVNKIQENDSLHIFRYEYLYNGNGVGIGDFDGDGRPDLFVSGNTVKNKLYLNRSAQTPGGIQFEDVTRKAKVDGNGTWSTGVSVADVNGDGLLDIYVCHSGFFRDSIKLSNELYINQGVKKGVPVFKEMGKQAGLDAPGTLSTQAAFFDYDRDGDLDMFLLNHSNHTVNPLLNTRQIRSTPSRQFGNRLFRNDSQNGKLKFTDVTQKSGIINNALNFGLSITVADINQDGWPDLYTTSDYTEVDCYYVNNRDGTFTESLKQSFAHVSKFSMGADVGDFNNDGRPDVLTLDMLPEDNHRQKLLKGPDQYDQYHLLLDSGYYHQQMRNMLHLNVGMDAQKRVKFSEIGQLVGISNTDWSWAGLMADFDNDGWKDVLITNGYLRDFTNMDFLKYTVADEQLKEAAKGNMQFRTYGLVQKMPSNKLRNYVFRNRGSEAANLLGFEDVSQSWGLTEATVSNAAAYADFDGDGDLDLVISNINEPLYIYQNNAPKQQYLTVRLEGKAPNPQALGAKVWVYAGGQQQYKELYPVRGYQSSVTTDLHFGLGKATAIDSVVIAWPTGTRSVVSAPTPNQLLKAKEPATGTHTVALTQKVAQPTLFEQLSPEMTGLDFYHQENDFVDFKVEVLLPYQLSRMGPALARGDVNGDGREDLYFGGAVNQFGVLYLQTVDGKFMAAPSQPWRQHAVSEEVGAHFFDADQDGDLDLYVVCGGNEYDDQSPEYQDHLYLNQGDGTLLYAPAALPAMLSSKQCVVSADIDGDGDLDLFVGGRAVPGSYPEAARSYLLRNDGTSGQPRFTDVTAEWSPLLLNPGMITAATFADLDADGRKDLVLVGDWMGIRTFRNKTNGFGEVTDKSLLQTEGMWASITATDLDGDGDMDFVVGNSGLNNQFKASVDKPMTLHFDDFDKNGVIDPITSYYVGDKSYPMFSRDEMLDQMVPLRRKYTSYASYADATTEDLFGKAAVENARKLYCRQLSSVVLENKGGFSFAVHELPQAAQVSRISGIVADDVDGDSKTDLVVAGNFSPYRVQLGPCDASFGLFLKQVGPMRFEPVGPDQSGLWAGGDVRTMTIINSGAQQKWLVVGRNEDEVLVFKINQTHK
ncbi:VCBS repeat-containing protein [Telluribacter humicola]|uniref:VCBS repeat-containing protein n=1 Tax=Telluribacter humicola TaxID=1720261 RepID=UPI001E52B72C|nr:VCBS repeat-containing protein [Telluribacter humicola]